jgi:hypothetical protein
MYTVHILEKAPYPPPGWELLADDTPWEKNMTRGTEKCGNLKEKGRKKTIKGQLKLRGQNKRCKTKGEKDA